MTDPRCHRAFDHRRARGVWSPRGIEHCGPVVQTTVRSPSDGFHPLCEEFDSALPAVIELVPAVKRLQATAGDCRRFTAISMERMRPEKYSSEYKHIRLNDLQEKTPRVFSLGTPFASGSYQT